MSEVKHILLFSGKRKSGKDFLTGKLLEKIGTENAQIIRISEPIKSTWAKKLNLSLDELLSDGPLKEKYRKEMIEWSEEIRKTDPGIFCRGAMTTAKASIIIVSDIRRKTDVKWFKEQYSAKIKTIRITASDDVRETRGWVFTKGVDDIESECDLDDFESWDLKIDNDDQSQTEKRVEELLEFVKALE